MLSLSGNKAKTPPAKKKFHGIQFRIFSTVYDYLFIKFDINLSFSNTTCLLK